MKNQKGISIIEILLIPILFGVIVGIIIGIAYLFAPYSPYNKAPNEVQEYNENNQKYIKVKQVEKTPNK